MTGAHLYHEDTYNRRKVTAQSTWKKSHASIVDACECRNCRQLDRVRCGTRSSRSVSWIS